MNCFAAVVLLSLFFLVFGHDQSSAEPIRCRVLPKKPPSRPPPSVRPHFAQAEQPFVPYNILFLIDDGIEAEDRDKLKMATEYVNERLSKAVKARKLDDVRFRNLDEHCVELCHDMPFPEGFMLPCPLITEYEPPESIKKLNEANYTLVVRVLVRSQGVVANMTFEHDCPQETGRNTVAFAHSCNLAGSDLQRGPHHGIFVFCVKPTSRSDDSVRGFVLHETLHILMPISLGGALASEHNCYDTAGCKDKTWKEVKRQALNEQGDPVEITAAVAIGPFIQKAAKDHFGCDTAEGAEMQYEITDRPSMKVEIDHGHWSQHLFPDEVLAPYVSNLTLSALASHTKWYRVDQSQAEPLVSSKPSDEFACDVARKSCFEIINKQRTDEVKFIRPFCDPRQGSDRIIASHCSPDHQRQMTCESQISQSGCPFLMGTDNYMYDNEVCANASSVLPDTLATATQAGASFGPGTICVTMTNFPQWERDTTNAVCAHHECSLNSLILKFRPNGNDERNCYITCAKSHSNQLLTVNWCSVATHQVSIICPDYEQVCKKETTTTTLATTSSSTSSTTTSTTTTIATASTASTVPTTTSTTASRTTTSIPQRMPVQGTSSVPSVPGSTTAVLSSSERASSSKSSSASAIIESVSMRIVAVIVILSYTPIMKM